MPNFLYFLILLLGMTVTNSHAGLSEDLQDGRHVLLMRHADALGFGIHLATSSTSVRHNEI